MKRRLIAIFSICGFALFAKFNMSASWAASERQESAGLTVAAIIGKQVCYFAVLERGLNRLAVGLGMIPRREAGLIFAGIGASLTLPNAQGVSEPVIGPATFGAVVIMIIITTLVTPPALKLALQRET